MLNTVILKLDIGFYREILTFFFGRPIIVVNIILLSGGSGKRLWPLSNDVRSKQFLKIYKNEDGSYESMVQRVFKQIKTVDPEATVTIATSKSQVSALRNQLGENVHLSVEPTRRDTFPAIALAVAYMHDVLSIDQRDTVSVCPVDHYVDLDYYKVAEQISEEVLHDDTDLVLMGIEPTYPSEKYGYIVPEGNSFPEWVQQFREKPNMEIAEQLICQGALWNAGVFAFKLKYVLDMAKMVFGTCSYDELINVYHSLQKISFDYAVVERAKRVKVVRYTGTWRDIGSWSMLTKTMDDSEIGNVIADKSCSDSHFINNLDIPLICTGLRHITVAASPDGILVAENNAADQIKGHVEQLDRDVMFAEKSWGDFHVLDVRPDCLTIKVTMRANDNMTYHSHDHRDEVWTVVSGQGKTIVDGMEQLVGPGDVITIQAGCKHTIFSVTDLVLIEVQLGEDISASDKHKYDMP